MASYADWRDGPTYRPVSDLEPHPTKPEMSKGEWRVELLSPPPLADWAALTGEILYQLRSMLEHLAYLVARSDGRPARPATRHRLLRSSSMRPSTTAPAAAAQICMIAGMSGAARALRQSSCSRSTRDRTTSRGLRPLWLLHELSDTDRHATPHLAAGLAPA